jgi:2-desacetyl-2-hydroxyethyl bacteriochlorophyllide A dehydrogenase
VSQAQAIVFRAPRQVVVEAVDTPRLATSDVLVDIAYSSISPGTERWVLTDRMVVPGRPDLAAFPHVPGYQAAGVVREVGEAVEGITIGDRVFSRNCRAPDDWSGSWWGGHVRWHVAHYQHVIRLPAMVSMRDASSLLLAQVGYNGAMKPPVCPGDVAVVIGAGLVGQYAGQVLRSRGAYVIMCDLRTFRLEKASRCSADEVVDSSQEDLQSYIRERYPDGVDLVLETASGNSTIRLGIDLLKTGGDLVLNGYYPPGESTLDWHWLRTKEIAVYCPNSRTRARLENTLGLVESGHLNIAELVTHEFRVSEAPHAYNLLLSPSVDSLGIVLNWGV